MKFKWWTLKRGLGIRVKITDDIDKENGKQKYRPAIVIKSYPSHKEMKINLKIKNIEFKSENFRGYIFMSEGEKKKKKKKAIIAGIIGSVALIGGGIGGIIAAIPETEAKNEEENEEEKKKPLIPNPKSQPNLKIDLQTTLTQDQRNLGTIATNGKNLTVDMIKAKLPANIQNEFDITIQQGNKATVSAKTGANAKYKGNVEVTYTLDTKQNLFSLLINWNPTIVTNGQTFTSAQKIEQLKKKLPTGIDKQQVEITISGTTATVSAKTGANAKYKGLPIRFKVLQLDK